MITVKAILRPLSAFGTPMAGDTLFGHLCWAVRERFGEPRLTELLDGYSAGRPFLAISDAFPSGFLPKPALPDFLLGRENDPVARKEIRKRAWLPAESHDLPLGAWLDQASAATTARSEVVTQNTINRLTGTTGTDMFAPRQVDRLVYPDAALLDVYAVLDDGRFTRGELRTLLEDIGDTGYGRDVTTGLGKFSVEELNEHAWQNPAARHGLTLAPCAPAPESLDATACFYQPLTRFGRHGNVAVRHRNLFKNPVLLVRTGAFLTFREPFAAAFHGRGLGGEQEPISDIIPQTVHQGYAPLVPLDAELRP